MAKDRISILHIACFGNNIGDNANICGIQRTLAEDFSCEISFTPEDLRDYNWGLKSFDQEFIRKAKTHDAIIVGGGGFFDLGHPAYKE